MNYLPYRSIIRFLRYNINNVVIRERCNGKTYVAKIMFLLSKEDIMYVKKLLKKPIKFYRRNRLKCNEFCNAHCAYECPNIEVQRFEDWYDIPAADAGLYETSCKECRFYDRYMTCADCYFLHDKMCKYHGNFNKYKRGIRA